MDLLLLASMLMSLIVRHSAVQPEFNEALDGTLQGLARTLLSRSHLSRTLLGGTYNWQAPETLLGYKASFSADIFR